MKNILFILCLLFPSFALASTIGLQCHYKITDVPENVVQKIDQLQPKNEREHSLKYLVDYRKWWKWNYWKYDYWKYPPEVKFLIDEQTQQALPAQDAYPYTTQVKLYPEDIYIDRYVPAKDNKKPTLISRMFIDRVTGDFIGKRYAPDDSYAPYFKQGDMMYIMRGKCERWERRF